MREWIDLIIMGVLFVVIGIATYMRWLSFGRN